ncbi:MAG TPA: YbaN family protein [Alphaproteobacteria bacterium]|nr:YbaN family protein [Alphaproteobacteria bacterium]
METSTETLTGDDVPTRSKDALICAPARYALLGLAWANVGLGILGIFLPLLPTTVFLLIALWLFSKSSLRFHRWLYDHPRLGAGLRAWHTHRAIPRSAKAAAIAMMSVSWLTVALFVAEGWLLPVVLALVLAPIGGYILARPSLPA